LGESKRLLKFFESLNPSRRNEIAKWIAESRNEETRRRRARQIAERLMETMEAERDLPPIMQLSFRQNPKAYEDGSECPSRIAALTCLPSFITYAGITRAPYR